MKTIRFAPPAAIAALATLVAAGLLAFAAPAAAQDCTAAGCHESLLQKKDVHPATDSCDTCHESTGGQHPQKGQKTFRLAAQPAELCANCHDAFGTMKDVHPPVADGECTTCHDPHASDQPKLLTAPVGELCASCHDVATAKLPHGPVASGDCTACHTPHESNDEPLLAKSGDQVCFQCHGDVETMLKKKVVHPAVEMGCTSCHQPHGTDHPKLLEAEGAALCYQCHDQIQEAVAGPVEHPPVKSEKGCATCHSPHATDNPKLLVADGQQLCRSCHQDVIRKEMTVLHPPIESDGCGACHTPHGGKFPKLLENEFPAGQYVAYTDQEFALCFDCHDRDAVKYPDTEFATQFRDGKRNLHYLHVNNAQKGRSCVLCHDVHGAANDRLIADSVKFGSWTLPLKFVKTPTGGGCSPGCHRPYSYDREQPGNILKAPRVPEAAKPAAAKPGKD